jgi:hypothetical protein
MYGLHQSSRFWDMAIAAGYVAWTTAVIHQHVQPAISDDEFCNAHSATLRTLQAPLHENERAVSEQRETTMQELDASKLQAM